MKKLMGYLPYILGIIIIALIVLLIIVSSGKDDEVNTNDKTNTVSDKELTIDNGADNQTPETQANDGKENNGKKKKEDKTKDTEPSIRYRHFSRQVCILTSSSAAARRNSARNSDTRWLSSATSSRAM